ncbi:MAG: hypothetical protein JW927_20925 [Deltaproteobacteria bacterium]|nr:hypothetical protein [Deltaproteobacteria bacterium]
MKETTSNKMIHVIQALLFIFLVILSSSLYIQGKKLSELKERFDVSSQAGNYQAEVKTESSSFGNKLSQDDEEKYKKEIDKLETQIAEMQEWTDYLKKTLDEYDRKADSLIPIWRQTGSFSQTDYSIYIIEDFIKENNYPPELKEKLLALFNERVNALSSKVRDLTNFQPGKINKNIAEMIKQGEQIKAEYDKEIAKLLSREDLALLKEYEQTSMERYILNGFNDMLGDDKIEKEKEEKLIALMYNYRQNAKEKQIKKAQSYKINREGPDEATMARLQKDNLEYNIKLFENYASLAKGILSESQMELFEGIVNGFKSGLISDNKNLLGSEKEKSKE